MKNMKKGGGREEISFCHEIPPEEEAKKKIETCQGGIAETRHLSCLLEKRKGDRVAGMGESPNLKLISFPNVFFAFPQGKTFLVRSPPFFWREVEQEWKRRRGQEGFFLRRGRLRRYRRLQGWMCGRSVGGGGGGGKGRRRATNPCLASTPSALKEEKRINL